jgi:hypothetical protein
MNNFNYPDDNMETIVDGVFDKLRLNIDTKLEAIDNDIQNRLHKIQDEYHYSGDHRMSELCLIISDISLMITTAIQTIGRSKVMSINDRATHENWDFFMGMAKISPTKEVQLLREFLKDENVNVKVKGKTAAEKADFLYNFIVHKPELRVPLNNWAEACWQDFYEDRL